MTIHPVDHSRTETASKLHELMQLAYTIEARLLGSEKFPPLSRSVSSIRASDSRFLVAAIASDFIGAIELEKQSSNVLIASLVVHPQRQRNGIGAALVSQAIMEAGAERLKVETAAENQPALMLYSKLEFVELKRFTTTDGIAMVRLLREP